MAAKLAIHGGKPVRTRAFPTRDPFGADDAAELMEVLRQQNAFYATGKKVYEFEREFAKMYGVRHAITSTSGTSAIHVAVGAVDPDPGDEIITTPISDMGTVAPILLSNCVPVFADLEPGTFNLDPRDVERKITDRTRAIIVVHCWGQPAKMHRFMALAKKYDLKIIEDCAQAHLTRYKGRLVGTIGHLGAFSLQSSKHLQCGDGGVTITNDDAMGKRAALFVDKGCDWTEDRKYRLRYAFLGPCYRMTEFQGAVLVSQPRRLEWIVTTRQHLGDRLLKKLTGLPGVYPPERTRGAEHSYWSFPVRVDEDVLGVSPDAFGKAVTAEGVPMGGNWIGQVLYRFESLAHQITYGRSHCPFDCARRDKPVAYEPGLCPTAEKILAQLCTITPNERWTVDDVDDAAEAICKVTAHYARTKRPRSRRAKGSAR